MNSLASHPPGGFNKEKLQSLVQVTDDYMMFYIDSNVYTYIKSVFVIFNRKVLKKRTILNMLRSCNF